MPSYLIYVETLNPATHKIERAETPVGWVRRSRHREAVFVTRLFYRLRGNQRPYLDPIGARAINKILSRQRTAVERGRDASFSACWKAMLAAQKKIQGGNSGKRKV
jgi:hypothetical protein